MKIKVKEPCEFKIYIGSLYENETVDFCDKVPFSENALSAAIAEFQDGHVPLIPVRITRTTFTCGTKYREAGWEIAIINYPRLTVEIEDLEEFSESLAEYLLAKFQQNRITLVTPHSSIMYEEERPLDEDT